MYSISQASNKDGSLLTDEEKVKKMEASFRGDTRLAVTEAHNNTNFSEIREWRGPEDNEILVRFVFTTKVWNKFMEEGLVFQKLQRLLEFTTFVPKF